MAAKRYAPAVQDALADAIEALRRQQPAAPSRTAAPSQTAAPGADRAVPTGAPPPVISPAPSYGAVSPSAPPYAAPGSVQHAPGSVPLSPPSAAPSAGGFAAPASAAPPPVSNLALLNERIARLSQVRDWLSSDPDLERLVDGVIGQQVRVSERRQVRLGLVFNIVFLLAGWGLSLIGTPAALGGLLHH